MAQQQVLAPLRDLRAPLDPVRVWLFAVAALVFVMVSVGGATRLTGSGLSITEWQPIMGVVPPLSDAAWQEAFEKYRQIPQYRHVNKGMSLDAFKRIFWWEWTHRFLARFVGVVFLLPFLYFLATGRIARALAPKLAGTVRAGRPAGRHRLVHGALRPLRAHRCQPIPAGGASLACRRDLCRAALDAFSLGARRAQSRGLPPIHRNTAAVVVGLVFLQIVAGAFVAGLKAGAGLQHLAADGRPLIPQGLGAMSPWWANLFENATTVQFNHRMLAYVLAAVALWHVWSLLRADGRSPGSDVGTGARRRGSGASRARHLDLARAGAAVAGACASGRRGDRVRPGVVASARAAARLTRRDALAAAALAWRAASSPDRHTAPTVPDAPPGNWVDRLAPPAWKPYLRLARFDRPIGAWLLLFPAWWGQALAEVSLGRPYPNLWYLVLFWLGAFVMRGAGCTYNDIVDRDYDARVARTAARPIPSGQVTVAQAYLFLAVLCAAGFLVLIQFNLFTIVLGASSLLLIAIYPFMKRLTFWPQLVLGLTFKWGALVGWAAVTGSLSLAAVALYAGCGAVDHRLRHHLCPPGQGGRCTAGPQVDRAEVRRGDAALARAVLHGRRGALGVRPACWRAPTSFVLALGLAAAQLAWQVATLDTSDAQQLPDTLQVEPAGGLAAVRRGWRPTWRCRPSPKPREAHRNAAV